MNNYKQWAQSKQYESHINRMILIRKGTTAQASKIQHCRSPMTKKNKNISFTSGHSKAENTFINNFLNTSKNIKTTIDDSSSLEDIRIKRRRLVTQNTTKQSMITSIYLPAHQNKHNQTHNTTKNGSLKEKQHILQNLLLSKRLTSAKTVLNTQQDSKVFLFYKKISNDTSRKLKISQNFSSERSYKYQQFQKQVKNNLDVGKGKNYLSFMIKNILFLKALITKDSSVLYNLSIGIGKKKHRIRALSYNQLFHKQIILRFNKMHLQNNSSIIFSVSLMRANLEQEIGSFQTQLLNFKQENSRIQKIVKGRIPVGTVEISGQIHFFNYIDSQGQKNPEKLS